MAREWFTKQSGAWTPGHAAKVITRLEKDVFPWLGNKPIAEIAPPDVLAVARRIEERGALETAHRVLYGCGQTFRYAVATGLCARDPTQDLRGALTPLKTEHFPAITEPAKVGEMLRTLRDYTGTHVVRSALRLAPLVFVRPGELRKAEWQEIDVAIGEWRYLVSKTNTQHIVPLSRQAVEILQEIQLLTGQSHRAELANARQRCAQGVSGKA